MKEIKATKAHNLNQLHEELEAAVPGLRPVTENGEREAVMALQSVGDEITVRFPDAVDWTAVSAVISAHVARPRETAPDLRALWATYRTNVQAATTIPQIKAALVNDLGPLLRAIAKGNRGDLNGG
jgi:hypothetical protein